MKLGDKHSEEAKIKISQSRIGKALSLETKTKMSEAKKGRVLSDELKAKLSHSQENRKEIICLENNTKYMSITQASKELGISRKVIRASIVAGNSKIFRFNFKETT